jgi:tetratricopeptide (TPR) repeat protein
MSKGKRTYFQYFIKTFILIFLFSSFSLQAQNKKNKCEDTSENDLINFSTLSEVESSIEHATGWSKQDNGRWISDENRIPFTDEKTNKSNAPDRKLGLDNFIVLEMRKLMINDKQYNVLIKKYNSGKYEFPILREGWEDFKALDFYVFEGQMLKKILPHDIPWNKKYAVNLNIFARGTIKEYDKKHWEDILVGQVQRVANAEKVNGWNLVLAVFPIKNGDKEVCRFRLIKSFDNSYLPTIYTSPDNWSRIFDRSFYEVSFFKFKDFIRSAEENFIAVDPNVDLVKDPYQNYYNWGVLKYKTGDYPAAIEYFVKALEVNPNPDDFLIYSYLGNAEHKMRKFGDAIGFYDKALELKPKDVMDYSNWIKNYYNRGVSEFNLDDLKSACRDWRKALELGFGPAHDFIMEYCEDEEQK